MIAARIAFMKMTWIRLLSRVVAVALASLVMGASPMAAQNDCTTVDKMVANASGQIHSIATHVYTTTKIGGQSFSSEMIYAGGSMYLKMNGKWTLGGSIKDMEQVEKQAQHNANSKDTCRYVKDELVNGELAAVYSSHSETSKGKIDLQMWISKSQGRMLRQDMDSGGSVMSSRYEYANVKAPL